MADQVIQSTYRISNGTGLSMLCVAGVFDVISLVPIVNIAIIPIAWLIFWWWFKKHGVHIGLANPKRLLTMGGVSVIEAIPALSGVSPTWILGIGFQLLLVRTKDKTGIAPTSIRDLKETTGRTKFAKFIRRAKKPLEKQRSDIERARRMRDIRQKRTDEPEDAERFSGVRSIEPL